jgi:UDP-4-amino-4,6-dideoxy-N-acetyl-beta-L-altrosamine N-acetyltransferase
MIKVQGYLRPMNEKDLAMVLQWRNSPDVRRYMYSQHEISAEEHAKWFARVVHDDYQHTLLYILNEKPVGYVNFKQESSVAVADWGFYLSPDALKGTGSQLGFAALNYAFNDIQLHKVCGQALGFNEQSIRFHLKMGFQREGILRKQYYDGLKYHDIECFGLLSREWLEKNDDD